MKTKLFVITVISGLLLASPLIAQPGPRQQPPQAQKQLTKQERKQLHKSMKHKKMAMKHKQKAMRHKMLARENMRNFRDGRGGPMMRPDRPMGPQAPGFRGDGLRNFQNKNFGPGMNPDRPVGPRQHLRHRDGRGMRAQ